MNACTTCHASACATPEACGDVPISLAPFPGCLTPTEQTALRVFQIVSEEADDYGIEHLTKNTQLRGDLHVPDIAHLRLICAVEAEFSIQFADEDWNTLVSPLATVGDVLAAVERHA